MTPEKSLARGKAFLDEATENITFDEFHWALEEAWRGAAWVLNAVGNPPVGDLELGPKGHVPPAGTLASVARRVPNMGGVDALVRAFEQLRAELDDAGDFDAALAENSGRVVELVWAAWDVHDACGERIGIEDERLEGMLMLSEGSPGTVGSGRVQRRTALKLLAAAGIVPLAACKKVDSDNRAAPGAEAPDEQTTRASEASSVASVKSVAPLGGMQWKTEDPFLFCAYHVDDYPEGDANLAPDASLAGRHLGRDFDPNADWRMYHGRTVPGFPRHPHRGFETVTVVRSGMLDHSDSMGATARYGGGDTQWLTSGGGIQHAEMFPLLQADSPNPLELFQIWLNLPRADKMVDPYFTMLWAENIPQLVERDADGKITQLTLHAGAYKGEGPPAPPPNSWASKEESDLAIWSLRMEPGARFELPQVGEGTRRSLYVHRGGGMTVAGAPVPGRNRVRVAGRGTLLVENGSEESEILLLQGRPIGEPVAKRGPFVMNTQDEIRQAYADYQRTQFGGWPWGDGGPVHSREKGRFAKHIDGTFEGPT